MEPSSDVIHTSQVIRVLNDLLRILCRSLPAYLADAKPWTQSADRLLRASLDHLVADQRRYARRVAEAITERGGQPDTGIYPPEFTAKNDLSIEFLRKELVFRQEQDVLAIERCAVKVEDIAVLHSLIEETLGNAKGHLDILREMMSDE